MHDLYFRPIHQEFDARTMWSLSNAFTSAFKELDPIPQYKRQRSWRAFCNRPGRRKGSMGHLPHLGASSLNRARELKCRCSVEFLKLHPTRQEDGRSPIFFPRNRLACTSRSRGVQEVCFFSLIVDGYLLGRIGRDVPFVISRFGSKRQTIRILAKTSSLC